MAFRSNSPINVTLPPFRGVTRRILLTAIGVFFALIVLGFVGSVATILSGYLVLQPELAYKLIWEFVTYPFVGNGLLGLLFAGLSIWFFGSTLEDELGSRWMSEFFLASTIGGGALATLISLGLKYRVEGLDPLQIGASLWPFSLALLLAFARLHAEQELTFNFILRLKAKYLAAVYLLIYLALALAGRRRFDALLALTNALCAWLYLQMAPKRGVRYAVAEAGFGVRNAWSRAKRRRAAKKFSVYMRKQGRDVQFDESGRYLDPDGERRDPNDRKWMN